MRGMCAAHSSIEPLRRVYHRSGACAKLFYEYNMFHLLKSLAYFEDAEPDPMPPMLVPLEWAGVKQFFEEQVRRLMKELL